MQGVNGDQLLGVTSWLGVFFFFSCEINHESLFETPETNTPPIPHLSLDSGSTGGALPQVLVVF